MSSPVSSSSLMSDLDIRRAFNPKCVKSGKKEGEYLVIKLNNPESATPTIYKTHLLSFKVLHESKELIPRGIIAAPIDILSNRLFQKISQIELICQDPSLKASSTDLRRCAHEIRQVFSILFAKFTRPLNDESFESLLEHFRITDPIMYPDTSSDHTLSFSGAKKKLEDLIEILDSIDSPPLAKGKVRSLESVAQYEDLMRLKQDLEETALACLKNLNSASTVSFLCDARLDLLFKIDGLDPKMFDLTNTFNLISLLEIRRDYVQSVSKLKSFPENLCALTKSEKHIKSLLQILGMVDPQEKKDEWIYHLTEILRSTTTCNEAVFTLLDQAKSLPLASLNRILRESSVRIKEASQTQIINALESMLDENHTLFSLCTQILGNIAYKLIHKLSDENCDLEIQKLLMIEISLSLASKTPKLDSITGLDKHSSKLFRKMYEAIYTKENTALLKHIEDKLGKDIFSWPFLNIDSEACEIGFVIKILNDIQIINKAFILSDSIKEQFGNWKRDFREIARANPERARSFIRTLDDSKILNRLQHIEKAQGEYRKFLLLSPIDERSSSKAFLQDLNKILEIEIERKGKSASMAHTPVSRPDLAPLLKAATLPSKPEEMPTFAHGGASCSTDDAEFSAPHPLAAASAAMDELTLEERECHEAVAAAKKMSHEKSFAAKALEPYQDALPQVAPISRDTKESVLIAQFILQTQEHRKIESFLLKNGANKIRQDGSHVTWQLKNGCRFTLPVADEVKRGIRQSIANTILEYTYRYKESGRK